jgi:hypothetical protein
MNVLIFSLQKLKRHEHIDSFEFFLILFYSVQLIMSSENAELNNDALPSFKMPRAPPHVYSCFIVNKLSEAIDCTVYYNGRPGEERDNEAISTSIEPEGEKYFPRKIFQPDLPDSYCKWVKIITRILIKKSNGKHIELNYPFENVQGPTRNWEFHVLEEDILSKLPTPPANILKYEGLDVYER